MGGFVSADGRSWTVRVYDGPDGAGPGVGWEVLLFESDGAEPVQRLVYRPVGWLAEAGPDDLARALDEGEWVRARWGGGANPGGR